ncbi:MAG: mannitol dehydrogenase family protein [Muribaculaceae bacterium]|nr:mannitol dehydrogenase family protein [Muribaculaceae bacterium]
MNSIKVNPVGYDRSKTKSGILHIGVGNFHRAHEEFYTNELIKLDPSQSDWAITGAMLLPSDEKLYKLLKDQNGVYTVTVCGRDGKDEVFEIGSLKDVIWAPEESEKLIETIADPNTKIVSMTITEGGYNIDKETGEFNLSDEAVKQDLANPSAPSTVFGYLAEGLRRRRDGGGGKVTILTCDNLQHNGNTAKKAFVSFFKAQDPALAEWVEKNVTFPNSMVDRITPATRPEDIERLNAKNGTDDKAPVYCEDFIQWVVEDNFAAGRPKWEEVGVEFTDDVAPYENMKLSLLNASHTLLSYPSFLGGYRKVDEAMKDERIRKFVREFMDLDFTPYVPAPGNTDLDAYKQTLIERFSNSSVSDQVARLCFDGLSKFPVYVIPHLSQMVKDGKDLTRVAYLFAAYYDYLKYKTDDNGEKYEVAEPWMDADVEKALSSDNPLDFLNIAAFSGAGLRESKAFTDLYLKFVKEIRDKGAMATLETII